MRLIKLLIDLAMLPLTIITLDIDKPLAWPITFYLTLHGFGYLIDIIERLVHKNYDGPV